MKRLRLGLSALAMAIAIGLVSFTSVRPSSSTTDLTWRYKGPDAQTQAELNNPENYDLIPVTCNSGNMVCTIQAPSNGGTPEEPVLNQGDVSIQNQAYSPATKD